MKNNLSKYKKTAKSVRKNQIRINNERRILAAAVKIFAGYGYQGATMRKIAEEAGLPKANLHYYFQTKEQLYRQVLDGIFKDWLAAANTFDECEEPVEALRGYIETKMDLSRKRPLESRIWAEEILRGAPLIQDQLEQTLAAWLDTRVKRITDWINTGTIQALNPRILMYMIWAVTQHFADFESQIRALNQQQNLSDEQFAEAKTQVVQTILKGIGALD